jgi:hypothetical protein
MAFELHYHPGYFSEGVARLLFKLRTGSTLFRVVDAIADAPGMPNDVSAVFDWLAAPSDGEARHATCVFTSDEPRARFRGDVTTFGRSAERAIAIVSWPEDIPVSGTDAELGFMGRDLGFDLPSSACGSVAEEVLEKVNAHRGRVLTIITTKDTADALGDVTDFSRGPLANLFEYRRLAP